MLAKRTEAGPVIVEFALPNVASGPDEIVTGPDGNLWFAETYRNRIGRISTTGIITEFEVPTVNSSPVGIATGPDGNLWFTERDGNRIGRITPTGVISEFVLPNPGSRPNGMTAGPDGNLWDDVPRGGVGRRRVEVLDVDSVAQAVTARGASSMRVSTMGVA